VRGGRHGLPASILVLAPLLTCPDTLAQAVSTDTPQSSASSRRAAFSRGTSTVLVTGHAWLETWNYNLSREEFYGGTIGLGRYVIDRLSVGVEGSLARVLQEEGPNAQVAVLAAVGRYHLWRGERHSWFVDLALGVAQSDVPVPRRGTRFNYLARTGGGLARRLSRTAHLIASLEFAHLSNGGREGRDLNPDIQAMGVRLGIAVEK
jgi:hypothetical protein